MYSKYFNPKRTWWSWACETVQFARKQQENSLWIPKFCFLNCFDPSFKVGEVEPAGLANTYLARQLPHISSPKVCKDVGDYSWNPQVSHLPCELCRPPYRVWKAICKSRLLTLRKQFVKRQVASLRMHNHTVEFSTDWFRVVRNRPACSPSSAVMPAGCFCSL